MHIASTGFRPYPKNFAPARFGASIVPRITETMVANRQRLVGPDSIELPELFLEGGKPGFWIQNYPAFKKVNCLKTPVFTSGISSCAGLVLINKREGWHYVAHVFDKTRGEDIAQHFRDENITFDGTEVYILPGTNLYTRGTVRQIWKALATMIPERLDDTHPEKVRFVQFPKYGHILCAYNGQVGYFDVPIPPHTSDSTYIRQTEWVPMSDEP